MKTTSRKGRSSGGGRQARRTDVDRGQETVRRRQDEIHWQVHLKRVDSVRIALGIYWSLTRWHNFPQWGPVEMRATPRRRPSQHCKRKRPDRNNATAQCSPAKVNVGLNAASTRMRDAICIADTVKRLPKGAEFRRIADYNDTRASRREMLRHRDCKSAT